MQRPLLCCAYYRCPCTSWKLAGEVVMRYTQCDRSLDAADGSLETKVIQTMTSDSEPTGASPPAREPIPLPDWLEPLIPRRGPQARRSPSDRGRSSGTGSAGSTFFGTLFSTSFDHFGTRNIAAPLYGVLIAVVVLEYIGSIVYVGVQHGQPWTWLWILIGAVGAVLTLAAARLLLEFVVATVKTAENTTYLAARAADAALVGDED